MVGMVSPRASRQSRLEWGRECMGPPLLALRATPRRAPAWTRDLNVRARAMPQFWTARKPEYTAAILQEPARSGLRPFPNPGSGTRLYVHARAAGVFAVSCPGSDRPDRGAHPRAADPPVGVTPWTGSWPDRECAGHQRGPWPWKGGLTGTDIRLWTGACAVWAPRPA